MSNEYFKRKIKVSTNGASWNNDNLHIEFEVVFDDDHTPNVSTVSIFNLSSESKAKIKEGKRLVLEAGYEGDVGIILIGEITKIRRSKVGTDRPTVISVIDRHGTNNKAKFKKSYKKNISSSTLIENIANAIGLKIKVLDLPNNKIHKKGYNVDGRGIDSIESIARDCGASFYFTKGFLYIRDIKKGDNTRFTLTNETGLIGSPEEFTKKYQNKNTRGFSFTSLLQHKVSNASILKVSCPSLKGEYRVIGGKHIANNTDFFTVFEGVTQ